jgi:hypothetical protein
MSKLLAGLLAAVLGANALVMLFAPFWWYGAVPGVVATGPYNPHFVRDIGAVFLTVAAGLAAFAWRPRAAWPALAMAAGFLTLHAAIHVRDALRDLAPVYLPALIALGLAAAALRAPKEA